MRTWQRTANVPRFRSPFRRNQQKDAADKYAREQAAAKKAAAAKGPKAPEVPAGLGRPMPPRKQKS